MSVKRIPNRTHRTSLRFRKKLPLPEHVLVMMTWCKQHGYSYTVGFGKNRLPDMRISKTHNKYNRGEKIGTT